MRVGFPKITKKWRGVSLLLAPSSGELRGMVRRLQKRFGREATCSLLGVRDLTLQDWTRGRTRPAGASPRGIWLVHALLLRPRLVQSAFDLATWGRFRVERQAVTRPSAEWTDYEI